MEAKSRKRCHLSKRKTFRQKPQLREEVNDDHKAGYTRTQSPRQEVLDVLKSLNVHAKEEQNDEVTGERKGAHEDLHVQGFTLHTSNTDTHGLGAAQPKSHKASQFHCARACTVR